VFIHVHTHFFFSQVILFYSFFNLYHLFQEVKNLLERGNSPLHGTLARDPDSRLSMDRDLYYNAVVDKATLQSGANVDTGGGGGGGGDDSTKMIIIGGLGAIGICCFVIIVILIARRKRENDDSSQTRAKNNEVNGVGGGDTTTRTHSNASSRRSSVASSVTGGSRMGSRRNR
jgi:hypothetical protein